ncbi:DUF2382 domain-containing protein [Deinococcus cellulosilyticus]|uniref:DUF2382 domain-containing protein n=1 Tax=Deinococcus cellulosilyticus (strain DSM 18568 / NBRC 106333 / KACC 11606 / 5516J-15) TaxID=1223518 RepID=A0A511MWI8_DEIC1|nr:DUF2382 domain-containing protein [Deinococcus cellulosilyticus]GEM44486.1 hypothetical protein DC3_01210 [Deinococcus cellulosilyticus NBRC 106333 = KACC 11606]
MSDFKSSELQNNSDTRTDITPTENEQQIVVSAHPHLTASQESVTETEHHHEHRQRNIDQTVAFQSALEQDLKQKLVGTLELREEVPEVHILREKLGAVTVRRERRVREETVTVDLVTEVLVIETVSGQPSVKFLGVDLPVGQTMELEIYREEADVSKKVVRAEHIEIYKDQVVEQVSIPVELAREELVVDQHTHVVPSKSEDLDHSS